MSGVICITYLPSLASLQSRRKVRSEADHSPYQRRIARHTNVTEVGTSPEISS